MLGSLEGDIHARLCTELAGPHPGAVDYILGLDDTLGRLDRGDSPSPLDDFGSGDVLEDGHASPPRPGCQ